MRGRRSRITWCLLLSTLVSFGAMGQDAAGPASNVHAPRLVESLDEPSAVAVDAKGSIYICEALSHQISVFDLSGKPLRRWGRFGRGEGELDEPRGIAAADDGRIYVADTGNHRIQVFGADGRFERQWGRHGSDAGEFDEPMGLTVRGERVYVADSHNNRIQVFRRDGAFLFFVWSYGSRDGAFDRPVAVAVGADGNFYVSDQGNSRIQKFSPEGRFVLAWGGRGRRGGLLVEPGGIDERDGRLIVADADTHRLLAFGRTGELLGEQCASGEDGSRGIDAPSSVAWSPSGDELVVCSAVEDRCQVVSVSDLRPETETDPRRIARDGYTMGGAGESIVVASRETGVPFIVDISRESPAVVVTLGGPGREPLEFVRPAGFMLDPHDETVLVSDSGNARLQRLRLGHSPGDARRFDPARTSYVKGIGLDDQERLDIEPAGWALEPATIEPGAIVRDGRGRLVVADTIGRRIVVLEDDFHLAASWGGYGDEDGRFRKLAGIATDPPRTVIYVLDAGRRRVQAFDLDGRVRVAWGGPGRGPGQFVAPSGIATGRDGSVYVADRGANRIERFDRRGRRRNAWGSAGSGPGQFWRPEAVHVDGRGRVIVIDSGNRRAQAFTAAGRFLWEMPLDPSRIAAAGARAHSSVERARTEPRPHSGSSASAHELLDGCGIGVVSNGGRYAVCAATVPDPVPPNAPFAMDVQVHDGAGGDGLARKVVLDVDAAMPEHRHGMTLKPFVRAIDGPPVQDLPPGHGALGDGRFEVRGMLFHMPGRWEIHFDITHGAITERAQVDIVLD